MADWTITTNADQVADVIQSIVGEINFQKETLFRDSANAMAEDARARIKSQDDGKWEGVSKWVSAKKGVTRALLGAEEFVKVRVTADAGIVYGDTGSDWTLSQHDKGFENTTRGDEVIDGKITIDIVSPGPLGLGSNAREFAWSPNGNAGSTPARKIWATDGEATKIVLPIASKWLEKVVNDALQGRGVLST